MKLDTAKSPKERSQEIVEMLQLIEDKDEKLQFVIDKGKKSKGLEDEDKTEDCKVEGCVSNVWLLPSFERGNLYYRSDSDAVITKGIAALLTDVYSGATPEAIVELDPEFLAEAGITQHLTPNRRNGLSNMTALIHQYAKHYQDRN